MENTMQIYNFKDQKLEKTNSFETFYYCDNCDLMIKEKIFDQESMACLPCGKEIFCNHGEERKYCDDYRCRGDNL